jgi:hypothetical protein
MSLINIIATIDCDECGKRFSVYLDPADRVPSEWTLFEKAEDEVRGGTSIVLDKDTDPLASTSVQKGKMLCTICTEEEDKND